MKIFESKEALNQKMKIKYIKGLFAEAENRFDNSGMFFVLLKDHQLCFLIKCFNVYQQKKCLKSYSGQNLQ